jgi:hypothetical protein
MARDPRADAMPLPCVPHDHEGVAAHDRVAGGLGEHVGDDSVAVVDTGHHPGLTRQMIAEIRALTPKPVTCQGFLRVQSKPLREALAAGLGLDGVALTEARRKRYQR